MNEAEQYLQLRDELPVIRRGPLMQSSVPLDLSELNSLKARCASEVQPIDVRTFRAPTPWHAEVWLDLMANLAAQVAHEATFPGLALPYDPGLGAPLLRGQRDVEWGLSPTVYRLSDDEQTLADHTLAVFTVAMLDLFMSAENPMNSPNAHVAAGQHYGLATQFLDFTLDPHVAVFFACDGAKEESDVVVYGLPLVTVVNRLSAVLVLPSPWVHRVYRQRGVFLDCTRLTDGMSLREQCPFRIVFPASAEYLKRVVEPEKGRLLLTDPWYDKTVAWAKDVARATHPAPPETLPTAKDLESACGTSPYRFFFNTFVDTDWPQRVLEVVDWLAIKLIDGRLVYETGTTDALLRHNEALFRAIRISYEFLRKKLRLSPVMIRSYPALAAMEAIADTVCPRSGD